MKIISQQMERSVSEKMYQKRLFLHEQMEYWSTSFTSQGLFHTLPPLLLYPQRTLGFLILSSHPTLHVSMTLYLIVGNMIIAFSEIPLAISLLL